MGRAWRIEYEGALYHILSRGNEQKDIFYDDQDRVLFLKTIGEMSERFEIDVFAYVLMGNHYHLLLKTNRSNLSKKHAVVRCNVYPAVQPGSFTFRSFVSKQVQKYHCSK